MLKYLILVIQNSLTTAVLLSMLFAFVHLAGGQKQKKRLLAGFAAGVAAALVLSVLKHTTVLINREFFNIGVLSAAIISEIVFYILSWSVLSKRAPVFNERVWSVINLVLPVSLLLYCLPDIFLYPADFLMSGESVFSTDFLFKLVGYLAGLLITVLSGLALFKTGMGLSFKRVRTLLTAGLAVNMLNQLAAVVQLLLARRIIPMSKGLFAVLKPIINYNQYFLYVILAITLLFPVLVWIKSLKPGEAWANPAEHRKLRAASRRRRRWCCAVLAGYVLAVFSLTAVKAYDGRAVALSPAEPFTIEGGEILIPIESVGDGHLHRYIYTASDGTEVRFIIIKKNEAAFGIGLDACDICGPTGYYERGDEVVCKLCDVVMNISTIGFKGGCNPVPLAYSLSGGTIVIQTQNLESEKVRFK